MPVIKRYPNRKLYDTAAKQYITLEGVSELIRRGQEVQVVDHASGEDLTTVTLTQIILELEKKRTGFLPQAVLAGLIRSGGDTWGTLRRALASPLELFHQIDEEIERRIQALVARGELAEEEGSTLRDKLLSLGRRPHLAPWPGDERLERLLAEQGVVTRRDLQRVIEQIEVLTEKLENLARNDEGHD